MLNTFKDISGQKIGKLTVIKRVPPPKPSKKTFWLCRCDCGNEKIVRADCLDETKTRSCGCVKRQQDRINLTANHSHKMAGTHLYQIYYGMRNRCCKSTNKRYAQYGGRGIKVCEEWMQGFILFMTWALASGYKEGLSIDRIDNNGNYEPSNCRWVNNQIQCNNRRTTHLLTLDGKTQSMLQWCEELGIKYSTLKRRLARGLSTEQALKIVDYRLK